MTRLLITEYPMMFYPSLAKEIGVNEAILFQELHYWLKESKKVKNGKKWVCMTYDEIQERLSFFSVNTIKKIIKKLSDSNLILIDNFNESKMEKTNWYTINYIHFK